jgi:hypothetical protein
VPTSVGIAAAADTHGESRIGFVTSLALVVCALALPAPAMARADDASHVATAGVPVEASRSIPTGILRIWSSGAGRVRVRPAGIHGVTGIRQRVCPFTSRDPIANKICALHWPPGTRVSLRARPTLGSKAFFSWSESCFRSNPCVVTARRPRVEDECCGDFADVIATFNPVRLVILREGALGETAFVTSSRGRLRCPPAITDFGDDRCRGVFYRPARPVTLTAQYNGPVEWGFDAEDIGLGCFPRGGDPASRTCVARPYNTFVGIGFGDAGQPQPPNDHVKRLNVSRGGNKRGTITGPAGIQGTGIHCSPRIGSDCTESYRRGLRITLQAKARAGSVFRRWRFAPCLPSRRSASCSFSVGSFSSARAVFRRG